MSKTNSKANSKTNSKAEVPTLSTARFQSDRAGLIEGSSRYKVVVSATDPDLATAIELGSADIPKRDGSVRRVVIDSADPILSRQSHSGKPLPKTWSTTDRDTGAPVTRVALRTRSTESTTATSSAEPVAIPESIAKFL